MLKKGLSLKLNSSKEKMEFNYGHTKTYTLGYTLST